MSIQDDTGCVVVVTSPTPGGQLVAHVPVTDAAEAAAVAYYTGQPGAEVYHLIPQDAYDAWHQWAHPDYYATADHLADRGIAEPTLGRLDVDALRAALASGALTWHPDKANSAGVRRYVDGAPDGSAAHGTVHTGRGGGDAA